MNDTVYLVLDETDVDYGDYDEKYCLVIKVFKTRKSAIDFIKEIDIKKFLIESDGFSEDECEISEDKTVFFNGVIRRSIKCCIKYSLTGVVEEHELYVVEEPLLD